MRFFIPVAVLLPAALAWNPKVCNGVGGCSRSTWHPEHPFRCPDGTRLNSQETANRSIRTSNGDYDVVTKEDFPTSCLTGVVPTEKDILVRHRTQYGQTMYKIITESCTETNLVEGDCYNHNPNPFGNLICQIVDTTGKNCVMFPKAGECERWGVTVGRPHCEGWTPAQVEVPSTN